MFTHFVMVMLILFRDRVCLFYVIHFNNTVQDTLWQRRTRNNLFLPFIGFIARKINKIKTSIVLELCDERAIYFK